MKIKPAFTVTLLILLLMVNFYLLIGGKGLTVEWGLEKMISLAEYTEDYFWLVVIVFLGVRFFFSVISIPGSGVLTVAGGAIFGLWLGTMLTLIAVISGISIAFILSRYGWRQLGAGRFDGTFIRAERPYTSYGAGALLILRLTNFAPAFLVNSAFALTPMKFNTYFFISLPAVLPGIILFSAMGCRIGEVAVSRDSLQPAFFLPLAAAGLLLLLYSGCKFLISRILSHKEWNHMVVGSIRIRSRG